MAVSLVRAGGDLAGTSMLLRVKAPSARVTAFTTDDPAGDTIRLAAEQDAAIRCSPPPPCHAAPPAAHARFTWSAGS